MVVRLTVRCVTKWLRNVASRVAPNGNGGYYLRPAANGAVAKEVKQLQRVSGGVREGEGDENATSSGSKTASSAKEFDDSRLTTRPD